MCTCVYLCVSVLGMGLEGTMRRELNEQFMEISYPELQCPVCLGTWKPLSKNEDN
jgi:hypothetical protein